MNSLRAVGVVLLLGMSFVQLGAQTKKVHSAASNDHIPVWWTKLPRGTNASYVRGKAQSAEKQLAIEKATAEARADIAAMVESRWQDLLQAIHADNPQTPPPPAVDSITDLKGTRIAKQTAVRYKRFWTAYVVVAYPSRLLQTALLGRARGLAEWYSQVKNTQAIRSLESGGK
jgi:hypothetical protein